MLPYGLFVVTFGGRGQTNWLQGIIQVVQNHTDTKPGVLSSLVILNLLEKQVAQVTIHTVTVLNHVSHRQSRDGSFNKKTTWMLSDGRQGKKRSTFVKLKPQTHVEAFTVLL